MPATATDVELYAQSVALKKKKASLAVWIAVGGFYVGGMPFSIMASSGATRTAFIDSAISFMDKHGFDGIDIDWEYPGARAKGGSPSDTENFVTLVKEMKPRLEEKKKGLSVTIPGGSCMFLFPPPLIFFTYVAVFCSKKES